MPVEGERLIIEPSFPWASLLAPEVEEKPDEEAWTVRNRFWSTRYRATVIVAERDGRVRGGFEPGFHSIGYSLHTLGLSQVWGIEQEHAAVQLLGTMLRHHNFKQYLLTGMFLETSPRSGVTYLFRRLKPTVALAPWRDKSYNGPATILAALCMHPIAYYEGTWAGAMTPTDDVIAHLSLMRGDEAMFWRRCNQHPPYRPEAGL